MLVASNAGRSTSLSGNTPARGGWTNQRVSNLSSLYIGTRFYRFPHIPIGLHWLLRKAAVVLCWKFSWNFCRFPSGVPWKKYSGEIDGLDVHIVVPGKDKTLGLHYLTCHFISLTWEFSSWTRALLVLSKMLIVRDMTLGYICSAGVDSVGTVPCSLLTYASAVALRPNLLINAGTAGGFQVSSLHLLFGCANIYLQAFLNQIYILYIRRTYYSCSP